MTSIPNVFQEMNPYARHTFLGCTQSGKSYRVKNFIIPPLLRIVNRVIIYDPKNEYAGPTKKDICYPDGIRGVIVDTVEKIDQAIHVHNADLIVIQPNADLIDDEMEFFDSVCQYIYRNRFNLKNTILIVDEAESVAPKYKIPKYFNSIIKQLQAFKIGVICITQRAAELHNSILSQSEYLFVFFLHEPADLKAIRDRVGKEWVNKMTSDPNFVKDHKFLAAHHSGLKCISGGRD